eukprot:TRINITY_DN1052_c0_g1_i1.p1 TRINITY_DN1052_c0_g1~~TRINITY_DN1052_c0_g1_i1.p1  ORF type:complete len:302 (-),score=24.76 TRINITY_DN1052_c0_g1_i1:315-1121(-)
MAGMLRRGPALARRAQQILSSSKFTFAYVSHFSDPGKSAIFDFALCASFQSFHSSPLHLQNVAETEIYNRQRQILVLQHKEPLVAVDAWVAPNAVLVGDVEVQDRVSVMYGAVLRGDLNKITIQPYSYLGERTVVHAAKDVPGGLSAEVQVGKYVVIGANCSLRSCTIEDEAVIGSRCVLAEGSLVEKHAMLGSGSVVPPGRRIPAGELWAGTPAKFVRKVSGDEIAGIIKLVEDAYAVAQEHASEFNLPFGSAYLEAEKVKKALSKV